MSRGVAHGKYCISDKSGESRISFFPGGKQTAEKMRPFKKLLKKKKRKVGVCQQRHDAEQRQCVSLPPSKFFF